MVAQVTMSAPSGESKRILNVKITWVTWAGSYEPACYLVETASEQ